MDHIVKAASRRLETAMPQLIPQDKLDMDYVNGWKQDAEKALRLGRHLTPHPMQSRPTTLYHWAKSSVSGVWFIAEDGKSVDYLYAYQSIRLEGVHRASEALAYVFNADADMGSSGIRGVTKEIFFDYLLTDQKFVVTDSIYTPDGKRWFQAEYSHAFAAHAKYKVYAIDLGAARGSRIRPVTWDEFRQLQPLYWGQDTAHQKYRFAIEQP